MRAGLVIALKDLELRERSDIVNGIILLGTLPDSAAAGKGLRHGDVVLSVNGLPMSSVEDFLKARALAKQSMALLVRRGTHVLEFTLDLTKRVAPEALKKLTTEFSRAPQSEKPGPLPN